MILLTCSRNGNELIAQLPTQPPAGKLQYYIELTNGTNIIPLCKDNPVVIRFKGEVPASILIPHIFFIFFAMFFSNLTGLFAISKHPGYQNIYQLPSCYLL